MMCLWQYCLQFQLLLSLRYLAKGAFYSEVADTHGVSRSTVCRVIGRVVNSINANIDNIRFPTQPQSLLQMKREFYRKCSLPNIVGAIDGTLVPIVAPTENEEVYVCRKGFHALNCQAVSSPDLKFLDVVARWPGSTHDSAIFENSRLKDYLDNHDGMILLGDSGYALKRYLLTPIPAPRNEQEHLYNRRHRQGRLCIERTFGLLKSRFRCLHKTGGVLPFKPQKCASVFVACCRLHNLCLQNGLPDPPELDLEEDHDQEVDAPDNNLGGQAVRNQFVQIRRLIGYDGSYVRDIQA
ncbi:putative nuclease HARBI1 [Dreissena polymorpha]|uniref:putative nuclease HARBI1 n=1 Tax=Dreissena polymorpha TaxID=45954 RepID=UPI0022641858|nr:putative nuclease HARBI1 [Dreissena polymorpha]XP_052215116.1 putative nuclease HARBI1 [Dreissena polymorpha]